MNIYNLASVSLAFVIYIYLVRQIRGGGTKQNLATWTSWGLLDVVAGISLYNQGGNWYLLAIYVIGSIAISFCIFKSAKFEWGAIEITCFLLVIVSIVMWYQSGPWYATIISTVGVTIATFPQLKDAFVSPKEMPTEVYVGFTMVNGLSVVGGKAWTIEERFYPAVCTILCVMIVGLSLRKYFEVKPRGA